MLPIRDVGWYFFRVAAGPIGRVPLPQNEGGQDASLGTSDQCGGARPMAKRFIRYILAIAFGAIVGEVINFPLALAIDLMFGGDVTGGRWALSAPNVILTLLKGGAIGFTAGYIAQHRGKLMAALATFLPLELVLAAEIIQNRHILSFYKEQLDTEPVLWLWIAVGPAMIAGHLAVKYGRQSLVALTGGIGGLFIFIFYAGMLSFHFFTIVVAYAASGLFASIVTTVAPPFGELYWFFHIWHENGTIANQYDLMFLMLVLVGALGAAMMGLSIWLEKRRSAAASASASISHTQP